LKNHLALNELEIGFVTLGNMRANGVRTLGIILDPVRDARQGETVQR
jgi:hypothetical protein